MRRVTKLFNTKATSIDDVSKSATFTISDNQADRMGEVVDQKTWNFKDYMKNPIVLWGHDPSEPENVLGTANSLEIAKDGASTLANMKFDTDINPKAALVFNQIKAGTLRTVSVGFINHTTDTEDDVPVLKDNDLLEISVVPIPANPRAIALAMKEGSLSHKDGEWLMKSMRDEADFIEKQLKEQPNDKDDTTMDEQARKQISALFDAVTSITTTLAATNEKLDKVLEAQVEQKTTEPTDEKAAISSSLPTADPDTAWDGGAATKAVKAWASDSEGNIDFKKYRKAFFWVDDGAGDKQGDYKLPFATVVDGKLLAVWNGVKAAYGAVQGARGGVEGVDKDAVLTQIKKYYAKFGKDWPEKTFDLEEAVTKDLPDEDEPVTPVTPPADPAVDEPKDDPKDDPAKGGSDDQPGAGTTDELDPDAELTPELQEQIDKQLETAVA